jgi:membrane-bound lytic murein transglycosylase F
VLPAALQSRELVVITHNGPNTFYFAGDGRASGLEHDLATQFAAYLGPDFKVKFLLAKTLGNVIPHVRQRQAHIGAADLTVTKERRKQVKFSAPFLQTQQYLVWNKQAGSKPKSIEDLYKKRMAVVAHSSYHETLKTLKKNHPLLQWQALPSGAEELLARVAEGTLDFTVADGHLLRLLQNFYPQLEAAMPLGKSEEIAWAFPYDGDPQLYAKANAFFAQIRKNGQLRNLIDRYYGHSQRLNNEDITLFLQRTRTLLPSYLRFFRQAEDLTGLDWRLLAAISYQESHWDRFNTSPTNVRGMMMLTEETADKLGVTDRLDARQSILAGARYVGMLKSALPKHIAEPDRTWMALAAYNIGIAHLQDARKLALKLKRDPDRWVDLKLTLPLLNQSAYYTQLKYGYASGGAPVIFVESVRSYFHILQKNFAAPAQNDTHLYWRENASNALSGRSLPVP